MRRVDGEATSGDHDHGFRPDMFIVNLSFIRAAPLQFSPNVYSLLKNVIFFCINFPVKNTYFSFSNRLRLKFINVYSSIILPHKRATEYSLSWVFARKPPFLQEKNCECLTAEFQFKKYYSFVQFNNFLKYYLLSGAPLVCGMSENYGKSREKLIGEIREKS